MNVVDGHIYWTEKNGILSQYPYLTEDITCEVVVIGGGVTGAICAYYLSEAGIDTVLVEKNIIGFGSTSASTSLLDYEVDYDLLELQKMIGVEEARTGYKLCEKALNDLENLINQLDDHCDFVRRDILYYTDQKADCQTMLDEFHLRQECGFNVEWLDTNSAHQYYSFPIEGGILTRHTAGEIDPYLLAHKLIQKASEKNLRVFENTDIIDLTSEMMGAVLTTSYENKIRAKKVIVATGYDINNFVQENIVTLNRTYTIVTKPLDNFNGWYNRSLIRDNKNAYTYLRTTSDNRIIIGGGDTPYGNAINFELLANQKYKTLINTLQGMFPNIPNLEMEYSFTGLFGETQDGLPYIGTYEKLPHCYFCLGYGSNGILYAILGGQILRDLYLGNPWPELPLFQFGRSKKKALIGV